MQTRRELLRRLVIGGAVGLGTRDVARATTVTADDQRRWAGIVRDWDLDGRHEYPCVLSQINDALSEEFPEEWKQPYRGFVYGFRGMIPTQETFSVVGQWVAMRSHSRRKQVYLYASVPGDVVSRYAPGANFNIEHQFHRDKLSTPAGFAELWAAVRASQARILRAIDQETV